VTVPASRGLASEDSATTRRPARRVVAAFDKFRGTATAAEACQSVARAAAAAGWTCDEVPLADGGEGLLEIFGGPNRTTMVTGPLGDPVEAGWRLERSRPTTAIIEMAQASGLALVGGADGNDPVGAATTGVGELIDAALIAGAKRLIIGLGGSATTDGGFGAIRALGSPSRLRGIDVVVACDVTTTFVDAAAEFAPQKGANPVQVELLTGRLRRLAQIYNDTYGIEISELPGSGAAGGLAGGLAALGATLSPGFEVVADHVDLSDLIDGADLVITGEGYLDQHSFEGKVVGGVIDLADTAGVASMIICGDADDTVTERPVMRLTEHCGADAFDQTLSCLERCAAEALSRY